MPHDPAVTLLFVLWSRLVRPVAVVGITLVAAGWALRPLEVEAWKAQERWQLNEGAPRVAGVIGQGGALALLGGFRSLAADLLWLQANACWERCDLAGTKAALALVEAVDPRPMVFWLNGARMIGYDMAVWRVEARGGEQAFPAAVRGRFEVEQALAAIAYLERAFVHHPDHPLLHIEIANLQLQRLGDISAAAEHYRRAAAQPTAPFYAARIHAELLWRLGREREAYEWLVALHPALPSQNPYALAEHVLARLREMEAILAIPPAARYSPGRP